MAASPCSTALSCAAAPAYAKRSATVGGRTTIDLTANAANFRQPWGGLLSMLSAEDKKKDKIDKILILSRIRRLEGALRDRPVRTLFR